jgi:methylamine dehydrogenase heavy chain
MDKPMKHLLLVVVASIAATGVASGQGVKLTGTDPENLVLAPQKPGEHRVFWNDIRSGSYGRGVLLDTEKNEVLSTIDLGWEGGKVEWPSSGKYFYVHGIFMSRGFHGDRKDAVEIYDKYTFEKKGEIAVPPKAVRGYPSVQLSGFTDDDRFLLLQGCSPASSIMVLDLQSRELASEVETAGCAYVLPTGKRTFAAACGDGSLLQITIDDRGHEASRIKLPDVFDPKADQLNVSAGVRGKNAYYILTHRGMLHTIRFDSGKLVVESRWSIAEKDGDQNWVPADILQQVAVHEATGRLYVLMQRTKLEPKGGGYDFHRNPGTEAWVFDLKSHRRLQRIVFEQPVAEIAVSQDANPVFYAASTLVQKLWAYDGQTGAKLKLMDIDANMGALIQPLEPQ